MKHTPKYDLSVENWIPCFRPGSALEYRGISDALLLAHKIRDISDPRLPAVTFSMYRILAAMVYWPSPSLAEWKDMWDGGGFLGEPILDILMQEDALDLFGANPFLQETDLPNLDGSRRVSASYLVPDLPSGENVTHLEHRYQDETRLCPACCAKGLITFPAFAQMGGKGWPPSLAGSSPIFAFPAGGTLFHTIMLNIPIRDMLPEFPSLFAEGDAAPWHHAPRRDGPIGFLEGLAWPARRNLLLPVKEPGVCSRCGSMSDVMVGEIWRKAGPSLGKTPRVKTWIDPNRPVGKRPLTTTGASSEWRKMALAALPEGSVKGFSPCPLVTQAYRLIEQGHVIMPSLAVRFIGVKYNKAKPDLCVDREFKIPLPDRRPPAGAIAEMVDRLNSVRRQVAPNDGPAGIRFESAARRIFREMLSHDCDEDSMEAFRLGIMDIASSCTGDRAILDKVRRVLWKKRKEKTC